jgi:hypothetical protein
MGLVSFIEKTEMSREQYLEGSNLKPEHISMLADSREIWQVALIENIRNSLPSSLFLEQIAEAFEPVDEGHYEAQLHEWAAQEIFFMGESAKLQGKTAGLGMFLEEAHKTNLRNKCRLSYALNHPKMIRLKKNLELYDAAYLFFQKAGTITDENYLIHFKDQCPPPESFAPQPILTK